MGLTRITAQQISNIDYKQSVRVVAVSNVTLSGGAPVVVDGVSLSAGNRVLVVGQSTSSQNGLYYVATLGTGSNGTWSRSLDGDVTGEIDSGMIVMVTEGTTYADTQWKLTTNDPITVGTTALTFVQNYSANSISSGTSNVVVTSGSNVSIAVAGSNVAVFASTGEYVTGLISATGNITGNYILGNGSQLTGLPATYGNTNVAANLAAFGSNPISTTGNITAGYFIGNGVALTSITGANVTGTVANATYATSAGSSTTAGTVTTAAQTNITSVGTLGSLSVTGNITGGNLSGTSIVGTLSTAAQTNITSVGTLGSLSVTGNVAGGNLTTAGQVSATGNVTGAYLFGNASTVTGLSASKIFNGTTEANVGTSGGNANISVGGTSNVAVFANTGVFVTGVVSVTGNVSGGNLNVTGNIVDTGALSLITGASGNVNLAPNGTNVLVATTTGANITGTLNATGNANVGNLGAATVVATTLTGTLTTAAQTSITSVGTLGSLAVTGNITGGNLSGTSIVGTLTTAAQTNITSVGTLGSLAVTGNVTGGNINAGNITIATDTISSLGTTLTIDPATAGNAGLVVINGNLQVNGTTTTINSNVVSTNDLTVNYANNAVNSAAANGGGIEVGPIGTPYITWLYNSTANVFTSSGGVSAVGNITGGNLSGTSIVGTLTTAAQTNITSVGTLGSLAVTGNITSGNVQGTLHSGTTVSVTGQVTGSQFNGSGAGLTSIPGANVTGTVPSATSATSATTAGTVTTAAQGNITSVGTLTALAVTGNITSGNLSGTSIVGTLTTAAQTNITSVGTLGSLSVTGNITGGNITTAGNLAIPTATANTNTTQAATTAFVVGQAGALTPVTIGTAAVGTSLKYAREDHTHGGVGSAVAGTGISVSGATGAVTITNSGVTSIVAGTNISVSGATGAVTVNVSGTVASATTASQIDSIEFRNGNSTNGASPDTINDNGTGYVTTVSLFGQTDGALYSQAYNASWVHQIFGDYRTGQLAVRGRNSGTLTAWRTILDSTNYTSYAPTLTGTGASGTWGINVTGSAGSATTATSATTAGTVTTAAQGNITSVGTLTALTVSGAITVNSGAAATAIVNGATTGVGNIGSSTTTFNTVFAKATTAQYADLAENYLADQDYPVGTVLCIGGDKEVTSSKDFYSTAIVGTVSANPAYLMNSGLQGEHVVAVAFTGRVPCQVVGKIKRGDLLVASHQEGIATVLNSAFYRPGCVIGKALEEYDSNIPGMIEIIIGRF